MELPEQASGKNQPTIDAPLGLVMRATCFFLQVSEADWGSHSFPYLSYLGRFFQIFWSLYILSPK